MYVHKLSERMSELIVFVVNNFTLVEFDVQPMTCLQKTFVFSSDVLLALNFLLKKLK